MTTLGALYLVATPIGNLKDITLRAIEILNNVDMIACEDTRKTSVLLKHFDIHKPLFTFYEHNEEKAVVKILDYLFEGKSIALVSSAGTPGISDPGYTLVQAAIQQHINVTLIPGPSAVIMAVVLSGLPTYSFTFRGFPPRKPGPRRRFFENDVASPYTLVYYESPYRLVASLKDALIVFGDRQAALTNDLTKMFETVKRGRLSELVLSVENTKLLGEYTLVIEGKTSEPSLRSNHE
jgi:16S rRNA (cytidine1402-2'-O)-methyltransferase